MHCSSPNSILLGIHTIHFFLKVKVLSVLRSKLYVHYINCSSSAAPAATKQLPEDYLEKVKEVHQRGGYGSKGYALVYIVQPNEKIYNTI
jgi:hypothetical protein